MNVMMVECLFCQSELVSLHDKFCSHCGKKVPGSELEWWITDYFHKGFKYSEILAMLGNIHEIKMSLRSLKSKLSQFGLFRRKIVTEETYDEVSTTIKEKLVDTGNHLGYRSMWHSLRLKGIVVPRDMIMYRLQEIDPSGSARRRRKKLKRRLYQSPGPNFCWHIDGYDKLKHFGFPIHGCIDGFSRKLIWLDFVDSNNNPHVIADLYLNAVKKFKCSKKILLHT